MSQPACKPGSVRSTLRDGHSSGICVATDLVQPTRVAAWKPALRPGLPAAWPPLFGLAPGGVCPAADVAAGAVRSYRTLSPLPPGREAHPKAVCFLWHFPWGCPRRPLAATSSPWSPDFPPPDLFAALAWDNRAHATRDVRQRPSGRLADVYKERARRRVKSRGARTAKYRPIGGLMRGTRRQPTPANTTNKIGLTIT